MPIRYQKWDTEHMLLLLMLSLSLGILGCEQDMANQPRYEPLEASPFFADGRSARPLVAGTVARGHLHADRHLYTGLMNGEPVTRFPFPLTAAILARGRERYDIFCAPCHDRRGTGQGMVVQRGFPAPPSLHTDRLRRAPVGHFFRVISHGLGTMYAYADRVPPRDRWAIIAYIRALQLSQRARVSDVPPAERARLGGMAP